jgi:CRP-like cAMP-binding protein
MTSQELALSPLLRRLSRWLRMDEQEASAVLKLPHRSKSLPAGTHIIREGDVPRHCSLLLAGFAVRQKSIGNGSRSIHAVHMAGEFVDLQNALLERSDHAVQTLSAATVITIDRQDIVELALRHPRLGIALWKDTLVDASVFREWITNIARRDAQARIAHLFCELGIRLETAGLGSRSNFELPLTQEHLADATGITPVHVNRTLKDMEQDGLFTRRVRHVTVPDWKRLALVGDFEDIYLHLPADRT